MYENKYSIEKPTLINGDSKLTKNQFTKSLTSFHTKKNISKNISSQNPPKKPGLIKQDKSVKNKRVYLSSKKAKALNYLQINPISPQNNVLYNMNKEDKTSQKNNIYIAPSSVQRSYKYKNCYILNNLNNYHPNVIPGGIIKTNNNKYTEIKLSESFENNENIVDNNHNNSNSYTNSENTKTNGAPSNINENNSLIQPSINGLNTITFNINNNYNNCYNNYNSNKNDAKGFIAYNGYTNVNGIDGMTNKSVSSSNDFATFNSREKLMIRFDESSKDNIKNINIDLGNDDKVIKNKRSNFFKGKSNNKVKQKQNIYSNTTITNSVSNFINEKKNQKSMVDDNIDAKNYIYETVDNVVDGNFNRTKNIYKFNNKKNSLNNQRNLENKNNEIENTKSMNNSESEQKIKKEKNNENNNLDNKIKEKNTHNNNQYQTYSGTFRNNNKMIKVNMIETKKNNNLKNNEDNNNQSVNQQKLGFKNNNKSSNNLKANLYKNENKNIYGCKKYNKNNSQSNTNINIINNNKTKYNKNTKTILIQTYNDFKKGKEENENINEKEEINQTNFNHPNYKNELQTKSVNCLDCYTKKSNIIPLTRENSMTYIRKKSLNMKFYSNGENNNFASSRPSTFKHKKNYSISSSGYNSQRYLNEVKIDLKSSKNDKNCVYSHKNNMDNINEKTIIMPEYKIKLENIKSRINNLLNIYSLLALRSLNISNDVGNKNNLDKKEGY